MPRPLPARALELLDAGRDWEAERLLAQLERAGVRDPRLLRTLGWAKLGLGDAAGAATCAREALARAPNSWESHYALGMALRVSDVAAAERALDDALQHSRANRHCLLALSACALVRGDAGAAERFAREALEARPEDREARNALGAALLTARKFEGAAEAFPDAAEILGEPESIERETLGRGVALRLAGRFREAIDYYEAVLPAAPSIEALGQYSLALLAIGDLPTAWPPYSFRWFEPGLRAQRASYPVPMWAGQSLAGRTVLLRCEQGVGDVVQFIRYAPLVKALGATVLLELRPGLGALANAFPGVDAAFTQGAPLPTFDYWIGLLDLPRVFETTLNTIPAATPYLRADPRRVEHWRERLASYDGLKVGLVWAGDPRHPHDRERSIPLNAFAPLIRIAGVHFFSLQKGSAAAALTSAPFGRPIVDLGNSLDDYADTAAAIDTLDLIVTVDTSVAHLGGALGRPVWTLLAKPAEWRWLEEGNATPWYPTMRLFRQGNPGDWGPVIECVSAALASVRDAAGIAQTSPQLSTKPAPERRDALPDGIARACYTRVGYVACLPAFDAASRSLEHYGEWLDPQITFLRGLVAPDAVVVEIGAGVGYHALALAQCIGERGQVLAIEADLALRRALRENVAASDLRGVFPMPASTAGVGVDRLAFDHVDVFKIADPVYGAKLVEHGADALWRLRPTLFVVQPDAEALDALARGVLDFGYCCWRVDCPVFNHSNFNHRDHDIFDGAHAFALLAIPEERNVAAPLGVGVALTPLVV